MNSYYFIHADVRDTANAAVFPSDGQDVFESRHWHQRNGNEHPALRIATEGCGARNRRKAGHRAASSEAAAQDVVAAEAGRLPAPHRVQLRRPPHEDLGAGELRR